MSEKNTIILVRAGIILAIAGALLMFVYAIAGFQSIGKGGKEGAVIPTISVSGEGKAVAIPDMATLSFTVRSEAKTQSEASAAVNKSMAKLVSSLKSLGLSDADIKTTGYNLNPQYDYVQQVCPQAEIGRALPCVPGKQQLRGYEISQSIEISMKGKKNFDNAAQFLDVVVKEGATDVGQLSFTLEHPEKVQREAREKAIAEAKEKAEVLARQLGVDLVRITGFSEGSSYPMYAERAMMKGAGMMDSVAPTAVLPVGQNEYHANVNITYEIGE